jgi:hypothetical protein
MTHLLMIGEREGISEITGTPNTIAYFLRVCGHDRDINKMTGTSQTRYVLSEG